MFCRQKVRICVECHPLQTSYRLCNCFAQLEDEITLSLALLLLLGRSYPFGQVAFTVAVQLRPVPVDTEIFNDIIVAKVEVKINEGYDARFDKRQCNEKTYDYSFPQSLIYFILNSGLGNKAQI